MKKYLCLLFALIVLGSFYRLGWLRCPFLLLTGLPCPTCGVTRALDALLHGDLAGYWQCHPLALPLAAVVLLFPFRSAGGPFCQKALRAFTVAVLACNTIFFVFRLLQQLTTNPAVLV